MTAQTSRLAWHDVTLGYCILSTTRSPVPGVNLTNTPKMYSIVVYNSINKCLAKTLHKSSTHTVHISVFKEVRATFKCLCHYTEHVINYVASCKRVDILANFSFHALQNSKSAKVLRMHWVMNCGLTANDT